MPSLRNWFANGRLLLVVGLIGLVAEAEEPPKPYLLQATGQEFVLLKDWTFGNARPAATVHNKAELDRDFYYRYIWEDGKLDKFKTYWSYHRDYPEGDARSLHVFGDKTLTLKGRIPPGGGLRERGLESGLLRAKLPIKPGMYIEMRAKLPGGVGVWPNFWLEQGVQYDDGTFSPKSPALSEIDIFEFFNWDGRPETRIITCNVQTFGNAAAHGNPYDLYTILQDAGWERHLDLGFDCAKDYHVFALDWVDNKPIWLLDGKVIKQTYYEWQGPPAHLVVANYLGMNLDGVKVTQMTADEKLWDYDIDYIRIWDHKSGALEVPISSPSNLAKPRAATAATPPPAVAAAPLTLSTTGKWQNPAIATATADVAKLKTHPVVKVDVTVAPEADDAGWFMLQLAINGAGIQRAESGWLLDRRPGKAGLDKLTLTWDASAVVAKLPDQPNWFKLELVNQGDRARSIQVTNLRAEAVGDAANSVPLRLDVPAAPTDGPTQYPNPANAAAWPGKGPIRAFGFMVGERQAFWKSRQKDQGAVAFVGDSLTGGWRNLAKDLPKLKVANRGVGGDVSRGVLFRIKQDVLDLNPKAVVIEIGSNDLTAAGSAADMLSNLAGILAIVDKERPGLPVVLCNIPPSANPKAPINPQVRQAMNDGIREAAGERPNTYFVDLYAALAKPDGSPRAEYFADDLLHLNDAGHTKWAELLVPVFEQLKLQ